MASSLSGSSRHHPVGEGADAVDLDLDEIARLYGADP
jgi:hypothetical protein